MKRIYHLRRMGLLMLVFLIGVLVSGDFPTWVKLVFPAACALWLSSYDDARIAIATGLEEIDAKN